MVSAARRIIAVLAMVMASTAVMVQIVPAGEQPGRLRERFNEPQAPLAQQGGPAISLPSTVAPKGADHTFILVRAVRITGITVYTQDDLAPLKAVEGPRDDWRSFFIVAAKT